MTARGGTVHAPAGGGAAPALRPFQRRFLKAVTCGRYDRCALSLPRGNGKSWLAAVLGAAALSPGDPLFVPGNETVLCAASLEQARIVFRFIRRRLEHDSDYRFQDSANRIGIVHTPSATRIRALGSNGKTAMGLGADTTLVIADEPGAWETTGGELLADAIDTALGKPGAVMRAVYIGTVAPAQRGWWPELIDAGTEGQTYVQALRGDRHKWDRWSEIRKVNPLSGIDAGFRGKLLEERDKARADERLRARFLSYRLNVPTADSSKMLLSVDDWERMTARPVPPREGRPICGLDTGGGRAWSAVTAVWRNGRVECRALAPGLPDLVEQERRDRVPRRTYQRLAEAGALEVDEGLHVQSLGRLVALCETYEPEYVLCDRFKLPDLLDAATASTGRLRIFPRVVRWSEATQDIGALRRMAADGPLAVDPESRDLLAASLAVATVRHDDQGGVRLTKKDTNNTARDDVAAALTLAAGAVARAPAPRTGAVSRLCG